MNTQPTNQKNNSNTETHSYVGLIPLSLSMMRSLAIAIIIVMTLSTALLSQPALATGEDLEAGEDLTTEEDLATEEEVKETPKRQTSRIADDFIEVSLGIGRFDGQASFEDLSPVSTGGPLFAFDILWSWGIIGVYTGLILSDDNRSGTERSITIPGAFLVGNRANGQLILFDIGLGFNSVLPLDVIQGNVEQGRTGFGYLAMANLSVSLPRNWAVSVRLIYNIYIGLVSVPDTSTRTNSNDFNNRNNQFDDNRRTEATGDVFSDFMYFLTIGKRFSR